MWIAGLILISVTAKGQKDTAAFSGEKTRQDEMKTGKVWWVLSKANSLTQNIICFTFKGDMFCPFSTN